MSFLAKDNYVLTKYLLFKLFSNDFYKILNKQITIRIFILGYY